MTQHASNHNTKIREHIIVYMEQKYPLITISGPPASGTSTLAEQLSENLDFELVNGGDIFRELANEKNMSLSELSKLSEQDDSIDKKIDGRLEDIIQSHMQGSREPDGNGLIVESRLAGWHSNGSADLSIYLDAPVDVRAERITDRDETVEELRDREQSEAKRYQNYYGIDITDTSVYDHVFETHKLTVEELMDEIYEELSSEDFRDIGMKEKLKT